MHKELVTLIETKGRISVKEASDELGVPEDFIVDWTGLLPENIIFTHDGFLQDKEFLKEGKIYHFNENQPNKALKVVKKFVSERNYSALVISRKNPYDIQREYQLRETDFIWLTKEQKEQNDNFICVQPEDIPEITKWIQAVADQNEEYVILYDGLESLMMHDSFINAYKALEKWSHIVTQTKALLLLSFNEGSFNEKEKNLLSNHISEL